MNRPSRSGRPILSSGGTQPTESCAGQLPSSLLTAGDRSNNPDVFEELRPRVGDVVASSWRNVGEHFLLQRDVGLSFNVGSTIAMKDDQSLLTLIRRVPPNTFARLELYGTSAHPAGLRRCF